MIIVSQDRNEFINFDNVINVNITNCEEEGFLISAGFIVGRDDNYRELGYYKTEERAKEVLNQIRSIYSAFKIFEITRNKTQDECALKIAEANIIPFVFEMPEE